LYGKVALEGSNTYPIDIIGRKSSNPLHLRVGVGGDGRLLAGSGSTPGSGGVSASSLVDFHSFTKE
jgi:hypothetical protein